MIKTLQTILRQDRERFIIPKEVQEIIPVNRIWSDGIFKSGNVYTKTFKFSDINYAMLSKEDTQTLFLKYCDLINSFECGSTYKLTIALSRYNQKALNESIIMPMCNDDMDRFRKESNARFMDEAIGAGNFRHLRYLTVSVRRATLPTPEHISTESAASWPFISLGSVQNAKSLTLWNALL